MSPHAFRALVCPAALAFLVLPGALSVLRSAAAEARIGSTIDAAAAQAFPRSSYDRIIAAITRQTSFVVVQPAGLVRWSTQTAKLTDFVQVPSPSFPDTFLYAMRYQVSVTSQDGAHNGLQDSIAYSTICQVSLVEIANNYHYPTVVCDPIDLSHQQ